MLSIGNAHTEISVECEACGHENTGIEGICERDTGACYPASGDECCTWCGAFLEDGSGQDPNYDEDAGCLIDPDVDRMRKEMWSEFAPDTELPAEKRTPTKRRTLSEDDYNATEEARTRGGEA